MPRLAFSLAHLRRAVGHLLPSGPTRGQRTPLCLARIRIIVYLEVSSAAMLCVKVPKPTGRTCYIPFNVSRTSGPIGDQAKQAVGQIQMAWSAAHRRLGGHQAVPCPVTTGARLYSHRDSLPTTKGVSVHSAESQKPHKQEPERFPL